VSRRGRSRTTRGPLVPRQPQSRPPLAISTQGPTP
jgi:hypothetical protein